MDNKTKEEILREAKWDVVKRLINELEKDSQQSTKHLQDQLKDSALLYQNQVQTIVQLQDELDSWKKEHFEMVENAANTIKELQDRVKELESWKFQARNIMYDLWAELQNTGYSSSKAELIAKTNAFMNPDLLNTKS